MTLVPVVVGGVVVVDVVLDGVVIHLLEQVGQVVLVVVRDLGDFVPVKNIIVVIIGCKGLVLERRIN